MQLRHLGGDYITWTFHVGFFLRLLSFRWWQGPAFANVIFYVVATYAWNDIKFFFQGFLSFQGRLTSDRKCLRQESKVAVSYDFLHLKRTMTALRSAEMFYLQI